MKHLMKATVLLLCLCSAALGQGEPEAAAVVKCHFGGKGLCTGICVDPEGIILSAKHCGTFETIECTVTGYPEKIKAKLIAQTSDPEGVVAYDLEGDGYYSVKLASGPPQVGDKVWSLGHPEGGPLERDDGVVLRGNQITAWNGMPTTFQLNSTNLKRVWPGWSGGPLFNTSNEVTGILSTFNAGFDEAGNLTQAATESDWISYADTKKVYKQALQAVAGEEVLVYYFTAPWCHFCKKLEKDIAKGEFPGYKFVPVTYYQETGTFSDPEIYERFMAEVGGHAELRLPTVWVPGTGKYKEGYSTGRPLMDFLGGLVGFIFNGPPKTVPKTYRRSPDPVEDRTIPDMSGPDLSVKSELNDLKAEFIEYKARVAENIDKLKSGGLISKVSATKELLEVKAEVAEKLQEVSAKAEEGKEAYNALKDNPYSWFAALVGLISGPIKRRFA